MSQAATSCGVWRWPVKTGSDADRFKVDKAAIVTSIRHLRSLKAPSSFAGFQRRRFRGAERHTWQLDRVRLTAYKIEDDSDIHLVIRNAAGKTMIAEIPSPGCVSRKSLWRSQIGLPARLSCPATTPPQAGSTCTSGSHSAVSASSTRSTT